jgi:membrane protein
VFEAFRIPLTWTELAKRTWAAINKDDVLGLSAQLAFYFFLALFPAVLFLIALASFFPVQAAADQMVRALEGIAPAEALALIRQQIEQISEGQHGGLLTLGVLGALWSSSAAMVAIVGALNRAYEIDESRPWWKARLTAILLTVGVAVFILVAITLVVAGPLLAETIAERAGLGGVFEWTWKILQWPVVFLLVSMGIGLIYYFAPDAEQEWVWITPGSIVATGAWLIASLGFRTYIVNFGAYNEMYGAIGGVIILMLWFYISAFAVLVGAEVSVVIEQASPHAKDAGERVPGQKKVIGSAAARAYQERRQSRRGPQPRAIPATTLASASRVNEPARPRRWRRYEAVLALPLLLLAVLVRFRRLIKGPAKD